MTALASPLVVGFLTEMLGYPFMRRAVVAGVCIAVVAPLVGSFLVHRRMAMIGDTLAHTAFAGVAVGLFLTSVLGVVVPPALTALAVAVVAGLVIELLSEYTDVYNDVSMAIVLSGGFALGTVLVSLTDGGIAVSIGQYLFGSLSTLTQANVELLFVLGVFVTGTVLLTYRDLVFVTFDESSAHVAGVDVPRINRLLALLTALVVVGAMQMMGVILVAAMLVVPVATATQVARSFRESVFLAVVAGLLAVLVGVTLSYAFGLAVGGTIVLVGIGLYALVTVLAVVSGVR